MSKTVALAGLGAIGLPLARALDQGIEGLTLISVAAQDHVRARARLAGFHNPPNLHADTNEEPSLKMSFSLTLSPAGLS